MNQYAAMRMLESAPPPSRALSAVMALAVRGGREAIPVLQPLRESPDRCLADAADYAIRLIRRREHEQYLGELRRWKRRNA